MTTPQSPHLILPNRDLSRVDTIFIVGTGPSLDLFDADRCRGQLTIALNEAALYLGPQRCDAVALVDSAVLYHVAEKTSKWPIPPLYLLRKSFVPAAQKLGLHIQDMNALTRSRDIQTGSSAYQWAYEVFRVLRRQTGAFQIKRVVVVGLDLCEIVTEHRDEPAPPPKSRARKAQIVQGSGDPTPPPTGGARKSYRYARCMRQHLPLVEQQSHGPYYKRAMTLPKVFKGIAIPATGTSRVRQFKVLERIARLTKLADVLDYSGNLCDHRIMNSRHITLNYAKAWNNIHPDITLASEKRFEKVNFTKLRKLGI